MEENKIPAVSDEVEVPRSYSIILYKDKISRFDYKPIAINLEKTLGISQDSNGGAEKLSEIKKLISTKTVDQVMLADGINFDNARYVREKWTINGFTVTIEESEAPLNEGINDFIATCRFGSLRCPRCKGNNLGVADSRVSAFGGLIGSGRAMICKTCGYEWTPDEEAYYAIEDKNERSE